MNLKSISPTHIHLLGAAIAVLTLAASGYAVHTSYKSRQSGIESSKLQLTQVSDQLATVQRDRGRLVNKISNLESIVQHQKSITQVASINELAVQLVALAEKHELELEQFEPSSPTTHNQEPIQPISIRLSASYQSVTNWLSELHTAMPDIHVVALSISSQSSTSAIVTSDIRLNWYIPNAASSTP